MDDLLLMWLLFQLAVSFAILLLIFPIIFVFSKIKRWVSQTYMIALYGLFTIYYIDNMQVYCEKNSHVGLFSELGNEMLTIYGLLLLLAFTFNIVLAWKKRAYKIIALDAVLLLVFLSTPFSLSYFAESMHTEQGCEQFNFFGFIFSEEN